MKTLNNDRGIALVVAMIVLMILTVIGVAATKTAIYDNMTANAEKKKRAAFYAAEAGIEHARVVLNSTQYLQTIPASDTGLPQTKWSNTLLANASSTKPEVALLQNQKVGQNYVYNVFVSNNVDSDQGYETMDRDGLIFVRSTSQGAPGTPPGSGTASVEILLGSTIADSGISQGKTAQTGFGSDKAYRGDGLNPIAVGDLAAPQATGIGIPRTTSP